MNDRSKPVPPALLSEASAEEDAPRPRRPTNAPERTEILDAVTRAHPAALPRTQSVPVAPVRLLVGPTEHVDGPTVMLPATEREAKAQGPQGSARPRPSVPDTTRILAAAASVRGAAEALEVDSRPRVAQLLGGIAAAMVGDVPCGALEAAACRLTKELWLVDSGIGGRFENEDLGRLLVEIATTVLVGVDPYRKAALDLAHHCEAKAARYRQAAQTSVIEKDALCYGARAEALEEEVRHLRKEAG
jgi:hypothetical protein